MVKYKLLIIQQPGPVSASYFHSIRENDRKTVINPCPILQLVKIEDSGKISKSVDILGNTSQYIGSASLLSNDGNDVSFVSVSSLTEDPKLHTVVNVIRGKYDSNISSVPYERVLDGTTVSQCHILRDLCGTLGAYFIFEDLAINLDGIFKLKVVIHDITEIPSLLCTVTTETFRSLTSTEVNILGGNLSA